MNRRKFLINTGLTTIVAGSPAFSGANTPGKTLKFRNRIMRESHRGFSRLYPENTLPAFEEAINTGVDRIELDLRMSSDGKLVVIHDETVDRTTNGSGKVSDFTLNELQKLDAGSWKSPKFAGLKIPALQEVFDTAKGKCFVNIDLKVAEAAAPMVKLAEKMDVIDQLVITGKIPECTDEIRKANKSVTMFYEFPDEIIIHQPKQAVQKIREKQLPGSLVSFKAANETFIRESKLHGLSVSVWGALEETDIKNLIEMGVDSIMTDNLLLLNSILAQK
jgi:glycerophosphoryl diester phosphodiesterase